MQAQLDPKAPWSHLARLEDGDIPLAEAALWLARDEYPALDIADYLTRIGRLAESVRRRLPARLEEVPRLRELLSFLFADQGFVGNMDQYDDPRNSYLNDVLDRRLGIPISLSVLLMEVGRGAGLHIEGVSFPGHFLVKMPVEEGLIVVDAFHGGRTLSAEELRARAQSALGEIEVNEQHVLDMLGTASTREILLRMLRNLKGLYTERRDDGRALRVVDRMVALDPHNRIERRDRGLHYFRLEAFERAASDLEAYLKASPEAEDAEAIAEMAVEARLRRRRLH